MDRCPGQSNSVGVESLAFDWENAERRGKTRSHRALRQKGKGMVEPGEVCCCPVVDPFSHDWPALRAIDLTEVAVNLLLLLMNQSSLERT